MTQSEIYATIVDYQTLMMNNSEYGKVFSEQTINYQANLIAIKTTWYWFNHQKELNIVLNRQF